MTYPETAGATRPPRAPAPPRPRPTVRVEAGRGGLQRVVVRSAVATAEVYLQGAHVTAWAPAGELPVLWTSARSTFAAGSPIRGGVPVCFPWFGPDPSGAGPMHGVVRLLPWRFLGWEQRDDDVVLAFALTSAELDGTAAFALRYSVAVGARLTLSLEVANTGGAPLRFEEALHTYLAVRDVTATVIHGLGDLDRLDRLTGRRARTPVDARLRVVAETDHLYDGPGTVTVADWEGRRALRIAGAGSANTVVWNPWSGKAAALPDFGDDEWTRMVCVETCNVADAAVVLEPGGCHTLAATIDVGPLP